MALKLARDFPSRTEWVTNKVKPSGKDFWAFMAKDHGIHLKGPSGQTLT